MCPVTLAIAMGSFEYGWGQGRLCTEARDCGLGTLSAMAGVLVCSPIRRYGSAADQTKGDCRTSRVDCVSS